MADKPKETPIDPSLVSRIARGVRYVFGDKEAFFSPQQPIQPVAQEQAYGRAFDYQSGYNLNIKPRANEGVSFDQLRSLADGYDLLRSVIETRKDQMAKLEWTVRPKDKKKKMDARCEEVIARLEFPNRDHDWATWLRAVMEDLLVIDAVTVLPRKTRGGKIYSLDLMDGATIKRVIDDTGRTPIAPDPAYQQILKGVPAVDYTADELVYAPRNVRTHKVYGFSPVEQIIMTVNIALRRQISQLQYFTEGNIPEALISTPKEWTPEQIAQYQQYWDLIVEGDQSQKRKAKFVPDGMKIEMIKTELNKSEFDDWLARLVCFAFSVSPSFLIKDQNRAAGEVQSALAKEEGLYPIVKWCESLMTRIIHQQFGYTDLVFKFVQEESEDHLKQAQINQIYVSSGIKTADEVREELGLDPLPEQEKEELEEKKKPQSANEENDDSLIEQEDDEEDEDEQGTKSEKLLKAAKKKIALINRNRKKNVIAEQKIVGQTTKLQKKAYLSLLKSINKVKKADVDINALVDSIIEDWDWSFSTEMGVLRGILLDVILDGSQKAKKQLFSAGIEVGISFDKDMARRAVLSAKDRAATMISQINDSTKSMVRSTITQGLEQGLSNEALAKELAENYAFSDERALVIARTETAIADVEGNLYAYKAAGVNKKRWILGSNACEDCQANARQGIIDFDDSFSDGSFAPPAHPNCRCDVVPVIN